MSADPHRWRVQSPGDLSVDLPDVFRGDVDAAVTRSRRAFADWRRLSLDDRKEMLSRCRDRLQARQEDLARGIALEVGKPLREARLELAAVVAKFEFSFQDADRFLADHEVTDGPHPAMVRKRARGPAAVIAPFNFPIHLGHGAAVAYLLAGNTVIFKPSPLAANVCAAYAAEMQAALPAGVFELVQGWGATGRNLSSHPEIRSVCFTGSVPAGRALAQELATDYSKSLALELGGRNALIVLSDADLDRAAEATADGMCQTAGQRCNSTSRILVHRDVEEAFIAKLLGSLKRYVPGFPSEDTTLLGPLVNEQAFERYRRVISLPGKWLLPGELCGEVAGRHGYYVRPAILASTQDTMLDEEELFCPVASIESFGVLNEAIERERATRFGLTASVFTKSQEMFRSVSDILEVGNVYWNLPTTFSPSTLPFGGFRASGNGKPGARGFVRFAADEQAVQWSA